MIEVKVPDIGDFKDIPVIVCSGRRNIPDGEVFTAPVRDSVNGVITYNTPSLYQGTVFNGIRFEFSNGQIIKAECANATDRLNQILQVEMPKFSGISVAYSPAGTRYGFIA